MAKSVAIIIKNELNDYVSNLHEYLGPYCFTNGAFVIEDDGSLLALLNKYNPTKINGSFKSHTSFLTDPSQPIYECRINITLLCNGCVPNATDKVTDKNVKWYPFSQNGQNYIFLKLEGHPTFNEYGTINTTHAYRFVRRHFLKKTVGTCAKRREDCKLEQNCLPNAKELNHKQYQIGQTVVPIIESHTRVGDEFFVPLAVSKTFLSNIDKKMKFNFVNDTVIIEFDNKPFVEVIGNPTEEEPEENEPVLEPVGGKINRNSMPFTIRKLPNRPLYTVKSRNRTYAKATTLEKARAQIRLLYALERRRTTGKRR